MIVSAAGVVLIAMLMVEPGYAINSPAKGEVPAGAGASQPAQGVYALDPPHTFVYFTAQHMVVGRVRGRFDKTAGTITVADPAASTVDVSIESAGISTQNSVRDNDLRGPDFFNAAKFPRIEYHGRGVRKSGDGWVVEGALTIRGTTRSVPMAFMFKGTAPAQQGKPGRVAFHGTAAVKRADFGMARELLDEIGVVSASPDVWIEIDAELLAVTPAAPAR